MGWVPFVWFRKSKPDDSFRMHHQRQALAILLMLIFCVLFFVFSVVLASFLMVRHRDSYESMHIEGWLLWTSRKLFLCWIVFWLYGTGLALAGSSVPLPLASYFIKRPRWLHCTAGTALAGCVAAVLIAGLTAHALRYVRSDSTPGRVYLVYEDAGRFPRWTFALAFFPIARAAQECFGPDSAVILPVSRENIARALHEGTFVFLGTHGGKAGILLKGGYYMPPSELAEMGEHPSLCFVYLTSCDSGTQKDAWEAVLAPAEVITYPRLTAVIEHAWWLWFRGPGVVRELAASENGT